MTDLTNTAPANVTKKIIVCINDIGRAIRLQEFIKDSNGEEILWENLKGIIVNLRILDGAGDFDVNVGNSNWEEANAIETAKMNLVPGIYEILLDITVRNRVKKAGLSRGGQFTSFNILTGRATNKATTIIANVEKEAYFGATYDYDIINGSELHESIWKNVDKINWTTGIQNVTIDDVPFQSDADFSDPDYSKLSVQNVKILKGHVLCIRTRRKLDGNDRILCRIPAKEADGPPTSPTDEDQYVLVCVIDDDPQPTTTASS